jgi:hypothetical protein
MLKILSEEKSWRTMESFIKELNSKTTEDLEERKIKLYKKILVKCRIMNGYRHLMLQAQGNYLSLKKEYESVDRILFFRSGKVNVINNEGKVSVKPKIKSVEDMSPEERNILLKKLLGIQKRMQEQSSE